MQPTIIHTHELAMSKEVFFQHVMIETLAAAVSAEIAAGLDIGPSEYKLLACASADIADAAVLAHGPFITSPREVA